MNKVILSGGLTRDPELSSTASGKKLTKFSLAVSDYKSAIYFDCTCWDEVGERLVKYCKKGSQLIVEGRIKIDEFEKDGQRRRKYSIVVSEWEFNRGNKLNDVSSESAEQPVNNSAEVVKSKNINYQSNSDEAGAPIDASYNIPIGGLPF